MFSNNPFNKHRANNEVLNEDPAHYAMIAKKDAEHRAKLGKKPVPNMYDKKFSLNKKKDESVKSESFKYHIPEDIPANERTAFHGAAAAAAKDGKKNFSFGGKTHPVTMKKDTARAIADQKESVGKTAGDHGYYHLQKAKELAKKDGHDYDKLPQYDRGHDKHKDHYDSRAKKESVKKEDTMNEEYSKTNKASMTIKHGYDEGDGPDNKKFAKYINKNTGATVKHHKDGSTMSFHGSDHQIHKALQHHHSDDKKGLGDLNYHKKGKTHSDDHVDGQHTYKAEGTTFREKLMSLYEGDRAAHYKSATKPEEYDEKQKSSKGAMDMMKTPKSVEADGMKAAKDTADAIKKSAPGKKMRKGDQNKGDLSIKPSATPVKDPSAKIITAEEYGMFGKKISNNLLDAIAMVEDMDKVHTVDIDHTTGKTGSHEKKHGITIKKNPKAGPYAVDATGTKANLQKYLKKHYDGDHKTMHPEIYK